MQNIPRRILLTSSASIPKAFCGLYYFPLRYPLYIYIIYMYICIYYICNIIYTINGSTFAYKYHTFDIMVTYFIELITTKGEVRNFLCLQF